MIKRETYMRRIRSFIDTEQIKIFTGIRRSGKSVMLQLVKDELISRGVNAKQFIHINFEDAGNQKLCNYMVLHDTLVAQIEQIGGKVYLFFDEIQEVTAWEKCLNSLRVKFDVDIYVTGSNARLLAGEFATYLGGRYVAFTIYPFSLSEFMLLRNENDANKAYRDYITFGGMPFLKQVNYDPDACDQYLNDVYSSIVLKDIAKRNAIRDIDMLERIIIYVMANTGRTFSANSISKYFKSEGRSITTETVLAYLKACEDAYLFYRVKRQDLVGKKILTANEKFFIADHGIREAIYGKNQRDIELIMENLVYLELIRRGYKVTVGKVGDREVDFVAEHKGEKSYYQVCYLLAEQSTVEREFGPLLQIADNFPKYVISSDEFDMSRDGIKHLNIKEFLLE